MSVPALHTSAVAVSARPPYRAPALLGAWWSARDFVGRRWRIFRINHIEALLVGRGRTLARRRGGEAAWRASTLFPKPHAVDDIVFALLEHPRVRAVLELAGVDREAFERAIVERERALPVGTDRIGLREHPATGQTFSAAAFAVGRAASDYLSSAAYGPPDHAAMLWQCLNEPTCVARAALESVGGSLRALALSTSFDVAEEPPLMPIGDDEPAALVVEGGTLTSVEWWCRALAEVLAMRKEDAEMVFIGTAFGPVVAYRGPGMQVRASCEALRARAIADGTSLLANVFPIDAEELRSIGAGPTTVRG